MRGIGRLTLILLGLLASLGWSQANAQQKREVITIDFPGSNGTSAEGINPSGVVTGRYFDANWVSHGFVRATDGTITVFNCVNGRNTSPIGINPAAVVTGVCEDQNGLLRGFLRAGNGEITMFDVAGDGLGAYPHTINPAGTVAGYYDFQGQFNGSGFVRSKDGTITRFVVPGARRVVPYAINPAGAVAGYYFDANEDAHAFLRAEDGTITQFDPLENLPSTFRSTYANGINPAGVIAGSYTDSYGNFGTHGFLRAKDGSITKFDVPGAFHTFSTGINPAGMVVGYAVFLTEGWRGFVRATDGTITLFDAGEDVLTFPRSINPAGVVVGFYSKGGGATRGFIYKP